MTLLPGVYIAQKKNSVLYFRSSITYRNKHISLGSYSTEQDAHQAYIKAGEILNGDCSLDNYNSYNILSFDKYISLINFRDNNIYFKNPIYLYKSFFLYYMEPSYYFKFDVDDLFYYANHKIMKRGGHLFVSDYGMQVNILSRYGIKNYAVVNKDYFFKNGDSNDLRYSNIKIVNKYHGVTHSTRNGIDIFIAKIHINGDIIIGKFSSDVEAAIAYNKAADLANSKGLKKEFPHNYIVEINRIEYSKIYNSIKISRSIKNLPDFN